MSFNSSTSNSTYSFRQRDRIGVVGPNGVGKSTFLKVLTGSLELAAGSVRLGDTVRIGYYEQVCRNVTCHIRQVLQRILPPCVHLQRYQYPHFHTHHEILLFSRVILTLHLYDELV